MAELAITALAQTGLGSLFGGAAAGAAGAAAGTASTLTALQGLATTLGVIGTIGSAFSAAASSNQAANQADLEAGQTQLESVQRETQMKRELLRVLGENDANFAAAGIDLTGGIAAGARNRANKQATQELSVERNNRDFRVSMYRARANGLRQQAFSKIVGGFVDAAGQGVKYGLSRYKLGA